MFYRVRTITPEVFRTCAAELLEQATRAGFAPDLLVGVRTGGYYLGEQMAEVLQHKVPLLSITCRRPSTDKKSGSPFFKTMLRRLPYMLTNLLRIAEHIHLTWRATPKPRTNFQPFEEEVVAFRAAVQALGHPARILVADDAIDSGATLQAVRAFLQQEAGAEADVRLAAITVTTKAPLVEPDFLLHRFVLCRFPWSFDYHG